MSFLAGLEIPIDLESVIATDQLLKRNERPENYKLEAEVLRRLLVELAKSPTSVLQKLTDVILEVCQCESAGVTIEETDNQIDAFRWKALSGKVAPFINQTVPKNISMCEFISSSKKPQLLTEPARHFSYLSELQMPVREVLVVPFFHDGQVIGTVWAATHTTSKNFDLEDLRFLTSLSDFATAALDITNFRDRSSSFETALEKTGQQLLSTLEGMNDAFVSVDKNWIVTRVNAQLEKVVGKPRDVLLGLNFLEAYLATPEHKTSKYWVNYHRVMNDRVTINFEDYSRNFNYWTEVTAYPNADGGISIFFTDITKRKLAEESLATEQRKLASMIAEAPAGIALFKGPEHIFEKVNSEWEKLVSPRDYVGKKHVDVYPELAGKLQKFMNDVYKTGVPFHAYEMPLRVQTLKGIYEDRFYDFSYVRILDGAGNPYGLSCHTTNVTDRVLTKKKIAESEERLNLALTTGNIGFWDWNAKTGRTFLSESLMQDWGIDPKTYNHTLDEALNYIHIDDRARVWNEIQISKQQDKNYDVEYRVIRPSGEMIWVNAKGEYFTNRAGEADRLTGITINITERKKAAVQLHLAKQQAENANQLKSAFLANMSHEIRTPLGAMLGFADLLRDPILSPEERNNYIDILTRNGESLSVIINDILDLSKVEAGHLNLEYGDASVSSIASDVISLLQVKAKDKDLLVQFHAEPSTPKTIVSDAIRIRQILINIVSNAIKFTQHGSVQLRSSGYENLDGTRGVCFSVIDTGIGIAASEIQNVFKMFVQADGTMTRRFGGTGLGLALSRSLARSLGGDIFIESSIENKGSEFTIKIADQPDKRNLEIAPSEVVSKNEDFFDNALKDVNVLVVDDSADNQHLIWLYLHKQGALIDSAENGFMGYRKALNGNFDIVLMDIQMPEMDGYTATQKLRDAGYLKPIVALTAHAMSEVREKCLNVGCTAHLPKPINPKDLISTILKHTSTSSH